MVLRNRVGSIPLSTETVIDKNLWEVTLLHIWGEKKKQKTHNSHQRRKTGTSDITSFLKMVVQMSKKLPMQKWPKSITSSLINVNLKKLQKFVNVQF